MSPCSIGAILSPSARTPMCLLFRTACLRPIPPIIIFCRVLPGAHLIKMCKKLGYAVDETPFTVAEMMAADEVIVSSSGSFCLAAESIDGQPVGGKAPQMLKDLQDALVADFMDATAR